MNRRLQIVSNMVMASVLAVAVTAVHAAQHTVGQKGKTFSPKALIVKQGDQVVFKNDDSVTHHVYSASKGQEFNLRVMTPGEERRHTFSKPGTLQIQCGLHPSMRLSITVE